MSAQENAARGRKILVVDDNEIILTTLTPKLKAKGYQVMTATDGSAAITVARTNHPDLILLDLTFPPDVAHGGGVGWDGFVIMEWLRRTEGAQHIPVFIISVADPEKYKDRALAAGAKAFFHKPINHDELLAAIDQALAGQPD
jgi:two-component system, OmpR family, KDP operon response regulator KdpE